MGPISVFIIIMLSVGRGGGDWRICQFDGNNRSVVVVAETLEFPAEALALTELPVRQQPDSRYYRKKMAMFRGTIPHHECQSEGSIRDRIQARRMNCRTEH